MDVLQLVDKFISCSPDFYSDLSEGEIDDKHNLIVKEAYQNFRTGKVTKVSELRSWNHQSDTSVPLQFTLDNLKLDGFGRGMLRYLYRKIFCFRYEKLQKQQILEDIRVIEMVGGSSFLKENPVDLSPGVTHIYRHGGMSVNPRWLRYIYFLNTINSNDLLPVDSTWVDIGSYYGGLQGIIKKYSPATRMVMVDFHHQLCRSYVYLKSLYPDSNHVFPGSITEGVSLDAFEPGSFIYVPAGYFNRISTQSVDLVTNFFSFGEMRRSSFEDYKSSKLLQESKSVYLVNRFVSSPFFERTYDTDLNFLDYIHNKRKIDYFDVFPVHHYQQSNRDVLGTQRYRNTSSSYFEMITSNAS